VGRLDDRVALITGAERGIGLASAELFAHEGARIHLVGIREGELEEAVDRLGADRASATTSTLDGGVNG
jgi:NAD(P)-dependent dehydrogenase (short-subunit alcohol dehydrogenase family)